MVMDGNNAKEQTKGVVDFFGCKEREKREGEGEQDRNRVRRGTFTS